jgi:uncharacterized repeat protein (TIGR01451 family)
MTKLIRPLILSAIIVSVLASCSLLPDNSADAKIAQVNPALPVVVTIELTVQADTSVPFNTVGQIIKYNYNVKNIGSTSTPGPVTVTGATCPEINTVGNLDAALDVNETLVCTSAYAITQDDLNKGSVTTITTATVNGISSNPVTTTVVTAAPAILKLTKTANPANFDHVGQTITYTYVITNSGTATLGPAQFTVTDAGFGTPINCGEATTTLAPNATVTCSIVYTITQANMDAGSVATTATASGGGVAPSQLASATVTKGAVVPSSSNLTVGATIKHQVVEGEWLWQIARCYGADPKAVLLANPQLSNPAQISPNTTVTVPNIGSVGKIYKTADTPCVKTHRVVSTDTWNSIALMYNADLVVLKMVNPGALVVGDDLLIPLNSAGSTAASPTTNPVPKALTLTTAANPSTYSQAGQVIAFMYVIKNSGTENLGPTQFTVTDGLISAAPFNCGAANTTLAPNASVSCSLNYSITQADMSAVTVASNATAAGGGAGPSPSVNATITKTTALLTLTTMASPTTYNQAGQVIAFMYVIKNSGNGNLGPAQFTVTDGLIGTAPFNCGAANTTLAPNATVTCTMNYTITQPDMTIASIANNATASGGGAGPSQSASTTVTRQ